MAQPTWHKDNKKTKIIINGEEWVPKTLAQQILSGSEPKGSTPKSRTYGIIVDKSKATFPAPALKPYIEDPRDF